MEPGPLFLLVRLRQSSDAVFCLRAGGDALWMVPGHMQGPGRLGAVFSADDIGLGHRGDEGAPWEGHCPREGTRGDGVDFWRISPSRVSPPKSHSDLRSRWKAISKHPEHKSKLGHRTVEF